MSLKENIAAFGALRDNLELEHFGKWVVFQDCKQAGLYRIFREAASATVERFGNGSYLIRRIGDSSVLRLPVSVRCQPEKMPRVEFSIGAPELAVRTHCS